MERTVKDYLLIGLKGIGMGAADIIPGVSGGTIAFISGIYEELIDSLKSINFRSLKFLLKGNIPHFFDAINGKFLITLLIGIGISVFSLAGIIKQLLANHPILVWSFFFGLIIASALYIAKKITVWNNKSVFVILLGTAISFYITQVSPSETTENYWFIFLSGGLAVCAMILPGISGSFILLLLGKYSFILSAVSEFKLDVLITLALGAGIGLLGFSNLLSWLFKKHPNITIASLAGFMIGSLNKIWPWKEVIVYYTNSRGEEKALVTENILPANYSGDSYLFWAISLAVIGFALVYIIESLARKTQRRSWKS